MELTKGQGYMLSGLVMIFSGMVTGLISPAMFFICSIYGCIVFIIGLTMRFGRENYDGT
jgi:hypothetical protein